MLVNISTSRNQKQQMKMPPPLTCKGSRKTKELFWLHGFPTATKTFHRNRAESRDDSKNMTPLIPHGFHLSHVWSSRRHLPLTKSHLSSKKEKPRITKIKENCLFTTDTWGEENGVFWWSTSWPQAATASLNYDGSSNTIHIISFLSVISHLFVLYIKPQNTLG